MNIQSLWIGESLSVIEKLCIQSFISCGHTFSLYVYQDVKGVPDNTILVDANEVMPLSIESFWHDGAPSVAAFSDVFRYKLLYAKGGIWVDTDVVCLRPFYISEDYCFPLTSGLMMLGRDSEYAVDNWFLKVPKGCEFIKYCLDFALSRANTDMSWGTIGPVLIASAVKKFSLDRFTRGPLFFPINCNRCDLFIQPTVTAHMVWQLFKNYSIAMHLYRQVWWTKEMNPNLTYSRYCIYEKLKRRYLVTSEEAQC